MKLTQCFSVAIIKYYVGWIQRIRLSVHVTYHSEKPMETQISNYY